RMARDNAGTLLGQSVEPVRSLDEGSLNRLDIPTLLIGGQASPRRYARVLDRLGTLLSHHRRIDIEGAAHGMNLAKPHRFNMAVLDFLGQHHIAGDPAA